MAASGTVEARYRPHHGGSYGYVQACPPNLGFCLEADGERPKGGSSSHALLQAVTAIDSDDDDIEVGGNGSYSCAALDPVGGLDSVEKDIDDKNQGVGVKRRSGSAARELLNAVHDIDSEGDDESDGVTTSPLQCVAVSNAAMDLCPAISTSALESDSSESEDDSESEAEVSSEENSSDESETTNKTSGGLRPWSWETDFLQVDQVDAIIRADMEELEAKKPWRFVYRCLGVPFKFKRKDDPFDVFFLRWDGFWRVHGRAIWERAFWKPLQSRSTEYHRRQHRQHRAMRAFRELATDLLERLGKPYRRWLGKSLHEGWWYRTEPFALRRLFLRDRRLYREYLAGRARDRWPRGRKFLLERGLKPMWWAPETSGPGTDDEET